MSTNKGCDVQGVSPGRLELLLDNTFALLLHNFFTYSVHQLSSVPFIHSRVWFDQFKPVQNAHMIHIKRYTGLCYDTLYI